MVAVEREHIAESVVPELVIDSDGTRMGIEGFVEESWVREETPAQVAADIFSRDLPRIVNEVKANIAPGNTNEWKRLSLLYSGGFIVAQMARLRAEQFDYQEAARLVGQGLAVSARDVREQRVWSSVIGKGLNSYIAACAQRAQPGSTDEQCLREAEACRDALAHAFGPFGQLIASPSLRRTY